MKNILILILMFCFGNINSQNLEISTKYNVNKFRDIFGVNYGHFSSDYNISNGISFGVGIGDLKFNDASSGRLTLDLMLSYYSFNGNLRISDGGIAGSKTTMATLDKQLINLEIYPLHFRLFKKKLKFSLGTEITRTIKGQVKGTWRSWILPNESNQGEFDFNDRDNINMNRVGLTAKVNYDFKLMNNLSICPNFEYSMGMSTEYNYFSEKVFLNNYRIGLNFKYKLMKKVIL